MAKRKLSSRQKMINMMYLVLIAMLVLNVDRRVLRSFNIMENNINGASSSVERKSDKLMQEFAHLLELDQSKAEPYLNKAKLAQEITQEFEEYMEQLKLEIESMYGGREELDESQRASITLRPLKTPDQFEKHAHFFLVKDEGAKGKEVQQKINSTRDRLLSLLAPSADSLFLDSSAFYSVATMNQLGADNAEGKGPNQKGWVESQLADLPSGALMATLSQTMNNARLLESDVISKLLEGVNSGDYTFTDIKAEIMPRSLYVMEGEPFEATIMLVASNATANPEFVVNGEALSTVENGKGMLSMPSAGVGIKQLEGYMKVKNPVTNALDTFSFKTEYQVFKPVATVSPEAMNLFYVGLDNPVSISVPGFSAADLRVSMNGGGRVSGSNGRYNVVVDGSQRIVKISVHAAGRLMGVSTFRVRNVPTPRPQLGGIENDGRGVRRAVAGAQNYLLASLGSDFAYDMNWVVESYRYIYVHKNRDPSRGNVSGNKVPVGLKQLLNGGRRGDILLIQDAYARDTKYGIRRKLPPLTINLI